jgi:lipid-A-disaccharide synthase
MYVILPFEKDFYQQYGMEVMYIGHPLAAEIIRKNNITYSPRQGHIGLLPGSRKHEIERILPEMATLARMMPDHTFHIAATPHLPLQIYQHYLDGLTNVNITTGDMHDVLSRCEAAVVTSGTATLETALLGVPQVVVYKGSPFSYQIAKRLIKVKYISLVNLIMGKQVVPELIQSDCHAVNMRQQLKEIMHASRSAEMLTSYKTLRDVLSSGGGADAAAMDIISDLDSQKKK